MIRPLLRIVGIVLVYAAAVGWLTWPLGAHLTTALPVPDDSARFDGLYSAWALAWESHALVTAPSTLADANIYTPARHALFYGPTAFGALPLFAPVYLATGNPTLAANVMYLGSVVLTATALHLVAVAWTGLGLAGVVAGWTVLTTRWMLWEWLPTAPHAAVLFYFPFVILLAADPSPGRRTVRWLLPLAALQCLSDVTYVAPAVVAPLLVLAVVRVLRPSTRRAGLVLAAIVAGAVVVMLPVWVGHLIVARENPNLRAQTLWGNGQAPTVLPWGLFRWMAPTAVQPVVLALIALGGLVRVFARDGRTPRHAWLHATYWSLMGLAISCTPMVVWGDQDIRLPTWFIDQWVPIFRFLRVPGRLGIAGLMGLALLAGLAFAECVARLPGRGRGVVAAGLAAAMLVATYSQFAHGFSWPFERAPLWDAYPVQPAIGDRDPVARLLRGGSGAVLELPLNPPLAAAHAQLRDVPNLPFVTDRKPYLHAAAMYRSIQHWRPLLNGYSSYYPADWQARMRLASSLPDATALATLRSETGLATIVVHTALCSPADRDRWQATATAGRADLRLAAQLGSDLVFTVASAAP